MNSTSNLLLKAVLNSYVPLIMSLLPSRLRGTPKQQTPTPHPREFGTAPSRSSTTLRASNAPELWMNSLFIFRSVWFPLRGANKEAGLGFQTSHQ